MPVCLSHFLKHHFSKTSLTICKGLPLHLSPGYRRPRNRYSPPTFPRIVLEHLTQTINQQEKNIGNISLLPLRTRTRGPAYILPPLPAGTSDLDVSPESDSYDPLDEVLSLFRANTFFRNFEIKGPADRLLIYGILFVSECLGKIKQGMERREAEKVCFYLFSFISMFCLVYV